MLRCEIGQIQIKIAARSFEIAYRLHRIIVWFENHEIRVLLYSEIFVGIPYLTNNFARMIQKRHFIAFFDSVVMCRQISGLIIIPQQLGAQRACCFASKLVYRRFWEKNIVGIYYYI